MYGIYSKIAEIENSSLRAALCVVISTKGSTPAKCGAKMLVMEDGVISGTIGGGALEMQVITDAQEVIRKKIPSSYLHALVHDHGMCCGGTVEIFIEPIMNKMKLYIFGAGHIGSALACFAHDIDFKVTVIDEREDAFANWKLKELNTINKKHKRAFADIVFDENTLICVITHNHAYDREIVAYCAKQPHAYLGMIGSRRKVEIAIKTFKAGKILTDKEMKNIDWPMGITITAQTPQEIAISILAKLIDVRNTRNGN